jgi:hypothetical protein
MKMATKKATGKTENRVSNSGPGVASNRKKLYMNSCTSKNGCHEVVHEDNTPATDKEIAEAETAGQFYALVRD